MVREGGNLVATSWDRALSIVADRVRSAIDRTPDAVAVLGSGQQTTEAAYLLGKLARGGIGTRYYDANTTLCMASAVSAYYEAFGSDAPPPTYDDIPAADSHIVWGANPAVAHPVLFRWIRESTADGELIVVDPVKTKTADVADRHVAIDPGTDLALARAVLARLVATNRIDRPFVDGYTTRFETLRKQLPDVETAADTAGVDRETIDAIANALKEPTLLYWGMGVNQSSRGTDTARALIDLCLASGNLGHGSGPFSLTGQANSMGTRVCASKGTWPGHRPFGDSEHRQTVADHWGVSVDELPDDHGPGPVGTLHAVEDGPIDVIWTIATNPAAGMPDATTVRDRLEDAFLIVQDAFRSETVEYADVVLPAGTCGETDGTVMSMDRSVSRVRPIADPPGAAHRDIDIVAAAGKRIVPGLLPGPPVDPADVFDEFVALTAGMPADCSGIDYDRLDQSGTVRWPAPRADRDGGYRYQQDANGERPSTWGFPTESGRARFSTAGYRGPAEPPTEAYPIVLTTARTPVHYNTGVRSRRPSDTGAETCENGSDLTARVTPATVASQLGSIDSGDSVTLSTPRGCVEVRVHVDDRVPDGVVWLPIHHPATNEVTTPAVDPRSHEPAFKTCSARLDRRTAFLTE